MLKNAFNELTVSLVLKTESPLLIKEGRFSDEARKDWSKTMAKADKDAMPNAIPISRASTETIKKAVCDRNPIAAVDALPFFLPGSSLRGAWRGHLERTLRSFDAPGNPRVCDPLEDADFADVSCSQRLTDLVAENVKHEKLTPYRVSCPICRLFGNTLQGSRIAIGDADRPQPSATRGRIVQREHTRINRHDGRVTGAPLKFFGLQDVQFPVEIRLRNFELSHVILLGVLLGDLKAANIAVGSGKNKGYGKVRAEIANIKLTYFGLAEPDPALRGIAEHPDLEWAKWWREKYSLGDGQPAPALSPRPWEKPSPWRFERQIDREEFEAVWPKIALGWPAVPRLSARDLPAMVSPVR